MSQNKHLLHPEEEILFGNFQHSHDLLLQVNNKILNKDTNIDISYKMDGSPAIVFGYHPDNNKFFVGTKSVFNKNHPKINYSVEDINTNHGNNIPLSEILTLCLNILPVIFPTESGIYQGDILYTESNSKLYFDNYIEFCSNVLTYRCDIHSIDYDKIYDSLIGIAVHTRYNIDDNLKDLVAKPCNGKFEFLENNTVYIPDLYVNTSKALYSTYNKVNMYLDNALGKYNTLTYNEKSLILKHGSLLKMFYNYNIKNNLYNMFTDVTPTDYYNFSKLYLDKNINLYKTEKLITKHTLIKNEFLSDIDNNTIMFMTMMLIYKDIVSSKNLLVSALNTIKSPLCYHINNESTGPEGYVAYTESGSNKLILRHEFSKHNFINFQQKSNH